jgi:hypothetical protein
MAEARRRPVSVYHRFGEAGVRVTWARDCWTLETHLVPGEHETGGYPVVQPSKPNTLPRSAPPTLPASAEADALEVVRDRWQRKPDARHALELAGFTDRNIDEPLRRPRGNPRTPDIVYAAAAVLWEECPSRTALAERLGCSSASIKAWVDGARGRDFLQGPPGRGRRGGKATAAAHRLIEQDGREPKAILAAWMLRRL